MLAFDALLVDCRPYTSEKISSVFDLFVPLGIKKFFFIYDVDLAHDNSFYRAEAIDRFKSLSSSLSPRGVHAYIVYRLSLDDSISKNPELRKFFSSKKLHSMLVSLGIFPNVNENSFATHINSLLYHREIFPVFTGFDTVIKSSRTDFCTKLLKIKKAAFSFDINSLFGVSKPEITKTILDSKSYVLPCITHNVSDYVGIEKLIDCFYRKYGKEAYFSMSSLVIKAIDIISP